MSQENTFSANKNIKNVLLPFLFGILIDLFHSKHRERKKLGFSGGDVNFTIQFIVVLASAVLAAVPSSILGIADPS